MSLCTRIMGMTQLVLYLNLPKEYHVTIWYTYLNCCFLGQSRQVHYAQEQRAGLGPSPNYTHAAFDTPVCAGRLRVHHSTRALKDPLCPDHIKNKWGGLKKACLPCFRTRFRRDHLPCLPKSPCFITGRFALFSLKGHHAHANRHHATRQEKHATRDRDR